MIKQIKLYKTKEIVDIKSINIVDFLPYHRKEKVKTLLINNKINLTQRDKVIYICDECKKKFKSYFDYNKNFLNVKQYCKACQQKHTNMEKYGVSNPMQIEDVKNKGKNTMLKRYGVEHALQIKDVKMKQENTMIKRYGVKYATQNKELKEKQTATVLKKYGVNEILKRRDLLEEGMIKKYGVKNGFQSEEIKERIKKTNLEKYGYEHRMKDPKVVADMMLKSQATMLKKYGAKSCTQIEEIKQKIRKTKNKNNSWGKGGRCKWYLIEDHKLQGMFELKVANYLLKNGIKFIAHKGLKSIKYYAEDGNKHYYHPDFYLPEYDLYLEPHAKYWWDDKFEWKMQEIEKQVKIFYFDEEYNIEKIKELLNG